MNNIETISSVGAMKLALEALDDRSSLMKWQKAREALRQAINAAEQREQAQQQEPVAWQWLTTSHFRKKLPKDAEQGAWNPLYTKEQL